MDESGGILAGLAEQAARRELLNSGLGVDEYSYDIFNRLPDQGLVLDADLASVR